MSADIVNEREFHHRQEHEHGARPHPHVQGLHVRHCNADKIACSSRSSPSPLFHEVKEPVRKQGSAIHTLTCRQLIPEGRGLRAHGEESRHAEDDSGSHGVSVQPEADPRDDHDERGRQVRLHQVVGQVALEVEHCLQAAVVPWKMGQGTP